VNRETLERRLTIALSNLIVDDWRLLTTWVPTAGAGGERAICAALGWHVKAVMERSWDVDCEYNRVLTADEADVKRRSTSSMSGVPPTVTPDLIVHRRGLAGRENNVVVIEVKKRAADIDPPADGSSRGGFASILDIQERFQYQHAVLLNLELTPNGPWPEWSWTGLADRGRAPGEFVAVYGKEARVALWRRGKAEETRRYAVP